VPGSSVIDEKFRDWKGGGQILQGREETRKENGGGGGGKGWGLQVESLPGKRRGGREKKEKRPAMPNNKPKPKNESGGNTTLPRNKTPQRKKQKATKGRAKNWRRKGKKKTGVGKRKARGFIGKSEPEKPRMSGLKGKRGRKKVSHPVKNICP